MDLSDALGGPDMQSQPNPQSGPPNQPTWPGQPGPPAAWPGQQPMWPGQPGQPGGQPAQPIWPGQPANPSQPMWPGQPGVGQPGQPGVGPPGQPMWPGPPGVGPPGQPMWPGQPGQPGGQPGQPMWPAQPGQPAPAPGPVPAPQQIPLQIPYKQKLPAGCYDRMIITVNGVVNARADMFVLNLSKGNDIALHVNPRFNECGKKMIVLNGLIGGQWGSEDRHLTHFPLTAGKPFEMKVMCTNSDFKVAVNKTHIAEFKHRIRDLASINVLDIKGDITLVSVDVARI